MASISKSSLTVTEDGFPEGIASLTAVHNLRDVGKTINGFLGKHVMKEGLLWRSGRLDRATPADLEILTTSTNLTSIIDLRTATEHARRPANASSTHNPVTEATGATVYQIPFISSEFHRKLLGRLPWYRLVQLAFLYLLRFKTEAINIITTLVLVPLGLKRVAHECLLYCGPQVKQAFGVLAEDKNWPALVHCTQGKDRTGIITLLVLLSVLGDSDDVVRAMDYDYMLSNEGLKGVRQEIIDEMGPLGFTEESGWADAEAGWVESVVEFIKKNWGSAEYYLESIGVGNEVVEHLKGLLLIDYA